MKNKKTIKCKTCGKIFPIINSRALTAKYCSNECRIKYKYLDKFDVKGYIAIKQHAGYLYEHRIVMSEYLGRELDSSEHIHHIDFDKQNNNVDNLLLMSVAEHVKLHRYGLKDETKWAKLTCTCGQEFERYKCKIKSKISFCSSKCRSMNHKPNSVSKAIYC